MKIIEIATIDLIYYLFSFLFIGILLGILQPFIIKWIRNILGKNKNVLPKYENKPVIPAKPKLLEEIEKYNQMDDCYNRYKYMQLIANRERLKNMLKCLNNDIEKLESKIALKTTKGGNYEKIES